MATTQKLWWSPDGKRLPPVFLVVGVVSAALTGLWLSRPRNDFELISDRKPAVGYGSPEGAFNAARAAVKDYIFSIYGDPVRVDPPFVADLHRPSKLWAIKGYAGCPKNPEKSYHWTVILIYNDQQKWEVLAKSAPPE